jgi:hypothetical protein
MNKLIFTTLFNSSYLCKGLAMYESLESVCDSFHIYIFAYDENSFKYLSNKKYSNATIISLGQLESYFPELLTVKEQRTFAEYCWTTTSYTILYCLKNFDINCCTYIDADLYFFSNPSVLVDEIKNNDVIITEHRYTPCYDQSKMSGKYCVQFMTFKNNKNGLLILDWWRERCLDWCYNMFENGRFGDQKYLDDWTTRFNGVHVLENLGGGLAPWNIQQYNIHNNGLNLRGETKDDGILFNCVFFHFHYFRYSKFHFFYEYIYGPYILNKSIINSIYKPYQTKIQEIHKRLRIDGFNDEEIGYNYVRLGFIRSVFHYIRTFFRKNKSVSLIY